MKLTQLQRLVAEAVADMDSPYLVEVVVWCPSCGNSPAGSAQIERIHGVQKFVVDAD